MRYFVAIFLSLILGPGASFFSARIISASTDKEIENVGTIYFRGFPIWFYEQAQGISIMGGWHRERLLWNTVVWTVFSLILMLTAVTYFRRRKNKAEQGAASNALRAWLS